MEKLIPLVALVVFGGSFAIAPVDAKNCKKSAECKKAAKDDCCEKQAKDEKASASSEKKEEKKEEAKKE